MNLNPNDYIQGTELANLQSVKYAIIEALVTEKYITNEQADDFLSKYAVMITKKSWFRTIFDKWFKDHDDESARYYKVIKFVIKEEENSYNPSNSPHEVDYITDINRLLEELNKATKQQNFRLIDRIHRRLDKLNNRK